MSNYPCSGCSDPIFKTQFTEARKAFGNPDICRHKICNFTQFGDQCGSLFAFCPRQQSNATVIAVDIGCEICFRCEAFLCSYRAHSAKEHLGIPEIQRFYHTQCLNCTGCNDQIHGPFSLWENQHPLCDRCLEERSPRCETCTYPVADLKVKTKFGYFHPDCFTCTTCKFPFIQDQDRVYFNVDGRPYCHHDAIEETRRPGPGASSHTETIVREG